MTSANEKAFTLPPHHLRVVLVEPDIPQNTGNIARLCSITGAELHLVKPLGFFLTEKHFRRSGMDYLSNVYLSVHESLDDLLRVMTGTCRLFSAHGTEGLWDTRFNSDDWLFFGSETAGLPARLRQMYPGNMVRIPMHHGQRCLNVSTAAGIAVYEALRQIAGVGQLAPAVQTGFACDRGTTNE